MIKDKYRVVYKPKGPAGEYAELALNTWIGCNHRCIYCYCPRMLRNNKFHDEIVPRKNLLKKLALDIRDMVASGDKRNVLLSFTTDPYNSREDELHLTRQSLEMLNDAEIPFTVLTKSDNAMLDFKLYTPRRDVFATTITCLNDTVAKKWEPGASSPKRRMIQLHDAYHLGIQTWVSLEPVYDVDEAFKVVKSIYGYTDMIKIGKLNHMATENVIDWRRFTLEMIELCERLNQKYLIKQDLMKYLEDDNG